MIEHGTPAKKSRPCRSRASANAEPEIIGRLAAESAEPPPEAAATEAVAPAAPAEAIAPTSTRAKAVAPALLDAAEAVLAGVARLLFAVGPRGVAGCALPAAGGLLLPAAARVLV